MLNNDILRSIRYMLDLQDRAIVELASLADPTFELSIGEVHSFLKRDAEPGYLDCSDAVLVRVLDGLVTHYRGAREGAASRPMAARLTNNIVIKKLRVAFEMKDDDMHDVFEAAGFPISKPELSALFRQPEHRNFRLCGDQLLRNFLKGLTLRIRGE